MDLPGVKVEQFIKDECNEIFNKHRDPFQDFVTKKRRLVIYKHPGMFILEPNMYVVKNQQVGKFKNNKQIISKKNIFIAEFNLENALKNLFEIPGLIDATVENMKI